MSSPADEPMIRVTDVCHRYDGGTVALAGVDLEVASGATVALIGPSGCGKSTLLRTLIGLVVPDAGTIRVDGVSVTPDTALELRRRVGYVIQEGGLFAHLTAGGNVELMPRWLGWSGARIEARLAELTALVQLDPGLLGRFPSQLSGGQRQRVSLMRALVLDPDVLLLDEPLGALDPLIRAELQGELREIFGALGKTVVLVTHDLAEAAFFTDDIVLMRDGHVVQRGALGELIEAPAEPFVGDFVQAQRGLDVGR